MSGRTSSIKKRTTSKFELYFQIFSKVKANATYSQTAIVQEQTGRMEPIVFASKEEGILQCALIVDDSIHERSETRI